MTSVVTRAALDASESTVEVLMEAFATDDLEAFAEALRFAISAEVVMKLVAYLHEQEQACEHVRQAGLGSPKSTPCGGRLG